MSALKKVSFVCGDDEECVLDVRRRLQHKTKFSGDILTYGSSEDIRKSYKDLTMRERNRRTEKYTKMILASCINRGDLIEHGAKYLDRNVDLAIDVITMLDAIKHRAQSELGINFSSIESYTTPPPEESGVTKESSHQDRHRAAVSMLGECSSRGYERVRGNLMQDFGLTSQELPSYYKLTKNRPKIIPISISPLLHSNTSINDVASSPYNGEQLVLGVDDDGPSSMERKMALIPIINKMREESKHKEIDSNAISDAITSVKNKSDVVGARIDGVYSDYINMIVDKQLSSERKLEGNAIVLDSYDGAEHLNNCKSKTGIISFSSQVFSGSTINYGSSSAKSCNILTWQQLIGPEKFEIIMPSIYSIFNCKKELILSTNSLVDGCNNVSYYDMHDGKMIYQLTQHSLYNRKYYPFLLCKCHRGDGVKNSEHECVQVTHSDHCKYYERSVRRWTRKIDAVGDQNYKKSDHMDWVDQNNIGISHFGLEPEKLRLENIRFDCFHLMAAVTKKIMSYLRKYILKQSCELIDKFSAKILSLFWCEYHLFVWNLNKQFNSFTGKEFKAFNNNIPQIIEFMYSNFQENEHLTNICHGMDSWYKIFPFLTKARVTDKNIHEEDLKMFDKNVKLLYKYGNMTFLTTTEVGDQETFYMHCLRYYMPKIAWHTYQYHALGLGVFTMQGYERRNKESKNTLKRFSNFKGNIAVPNIKKLHDIFSYNITDVC